MTDNLEKRLGTVEGQWSVSNRMSAYLRSCDLVKDVDQIAAHFTQDAIWEGVGRNVTFGRADGREAIRSHFAKVFERQPFTLHYVANAVIDIDAAAGIAHGTWMCIEATAIRQGTMPAWVGLDYEVDFARVDGAWLISHLQVDTLFATPYHVGWVEEMFTDMTAVDPLPPAPFRATGS